MGNGNSSRQPYEWSEFELQAVLALLCKLEHLNGPLEFATKLNEALNKSEASKDIPLRDVKDLLADIEENKKGALAFIERQPRPHVITRTKRMTFQRDLNFDGSMVEWLTGRKEEVAAKKMAAAASTGQELSFVNGQGVRIEHWQPGDRTPFGENDRQLQLGGRTPFESASHPLNGFAQTSRQTSPPYVPPPPVMPSGGWGHGTPSGGWPTLSTAPNQPKDVDLSNTPIPSGGWGGDLSTSMTACPDRSSKSNNSYEALRHVKETAAKPGCMKPQQQLYSGRWGQASRGDDKQENLPPWRASNRPNDRQ